MRSVVVSLLFLFLIASVSAFELETTQEASIYANETAVYTITVTNDKSISQNYELLVGLDPKWSYETDPMSYLSSFTVDSDSSVSFELHIIPISPLITSGKYIINIPVRSAPDDEKVADLVLYIKNPDALTGYLPSLNFMFDAQEKVDPRQTNRVKLDILNRNPLDIPDMQIVLTSALYNETQTISIEPLGSTTVVFDVVYDAHQKPMNDTYTITVMVGDKTFTPIRKQIEIISYYDIVEVQHPSHSFFFKTTQTTEYTNNGNSDTVKKITYQTTGLQQYFTDGNHEGQVVEESGLLYYSMDVLLPAGVPVTVDYYVNYRPIIYLLLLIGLGVLCYYYFRSSLIIKKEVVTVHLGKDGHTTLKILLHVKNRTMKIVDDVEVIDKIPAIAEIEKHFEIGTVKPEKVLKHDKAGTMLQWNISHFEAYEERIITYKVHSMYQIVGDFKLPPALLKFKNKKQQLVKVQSNSIRVGKKLENE
ncbi:MAG: hypothetical protein WC254_00895 [Candidatus Woesearchaeota archaeon]|jgi:hypothetical protein